MNTTRPRIAAMAALVLVSALALAGCKTTPTVHFHPEEVRDRMTTLCQQHRFQEARAVKVKEYPPDHPQAGNPSPEELVKRELVANLVNPAETAWKTVGSLATLLDAELDSGHADDEAVQRAWRLLFRAQDLMDRQNWAGAADVADRGLELLGADPVATSSPPSGVAEQLQSLADPAMAARFLSLPLPEHPSLEGVNKVGNIINTLKGSR